MAEQAPPVQPASCPKPELELVACTSFADLPDEVRTRAAAPRYCCRSLRQCRQHLTACDSRDKAVGMVLVQVLALVASLGLTEPQDVASFAATSRRCLAVCRSAPLRLRVRTQPAATAREEQAAARHALQALIAAWPGMF